MTQDHAVHGEVYVVAGARRVNAAGKVLAKRPGKRVFDEEEEVFHGAVVLGAAECFTVKLQNGTEALCPLLRGQDVLLRQHEHVRQIDLDEGRQKEPLRVGKDVP